MKIPATTLILVGIAAAGFLGYAALRSRPAATSSSPPASPAPSAPQTWSQASDPSLTLTIRDVGGVAPRTFAWTLK